MPATLPPVPNPPPPNVQRFDGSGRPTTSQITYETDLASFLKKLKAIVEGL